MRDMSVCLTSCSVKHTLSSHINTEWLDLEGNPCVHVKQDTARSPCSLATDLSHTRTSPQVGGGSSLRQLSFQEFGSVVFISVYSKNRPMRFFQDLLGQ